MERATRARDEAPGKNEMSNPPMTFKPPKVLPSKLRLSSSLMFR